MQVEAPFGSGSSPTMRSMTAHQPIEGPLGQARRLIEERRPPGGPVGDAPDVATSSFLPVPLVLLGIAVLGAALLR